MATSLSLSSKGSSIGGGQIGSVSLSSIDTLEEIVDKTTNIITNLEDFSLNQLKDTNQEDDELTSIKNSSKGIELISDEAIIHVLTFLRATDLASLCEVNKSIFSSERISYSIRLILTDVWEIDKNSLPPLYVNYMAQEMTLIRPVYLYVIEMKAIQSALGSSQPIHGYYISGTWLSNAKKYYENITIPDIPDYNSNINHSNNIHGSGGKKQKSAKKAKILKRIRQRRNSETLPPWPNMCADIICEHGNLMLSKNSNLNNNQLRTKKKLLDSKSWNILSKFYPDTPKFKSRTCTDCPICAGVANEVKEKELLRREELIKSRRQYMTMDDRLTAVEKRNTGVPSHALIERDEDSLAALHAALTIEELEYNTHDTSQIQLPQPLLPGIYHIIPRWWLKQWRSFIKDPEVEHLRHLEYTCLLCSAHGLLMPPPHVEEFLRGCRKNLLGRLSSQEYEGIVYEILTTEEWDALSIMHTREHAANWPDFSVRFSCDGEDFQWSQQICHECNPFDEQSDGNSHNHFRRRSRGGSDLGL